MIHTHGAERKREKNASAQAILSAGFTHHGINSRLSRCVGLAIPPGKHQLLPPPPALHNDSGGPTPCPGGKETSGGGLRPVAGASAEAGVDGDIRDFFFTGS